MDQQPKEHEGTGQVMEPIPASRELAAAAPTPADLLRIAVEQNADMAKLEKLMDLQERWEKNEARKAFTVAMAGFKSEPLVIEKRKLVEFTTRDGDTTSYRHAELSDVTDVICPALARHELSHRWDVVQDAGTIKVTCILTHIRGHSESVTLIAAPDQSGKKNPIQQVASAISYLQRYTLLAITGLSTKGIDNDGRDAGEPEEEEELISFEQAAKLREMVEATDTDLRRFLEYLRVDKLESIPLRSFETALAALKAKERAARGKAA